MDTRESKRAKVRQQIAKNGNKKVPPRSVEGAKADDVGNASAVFLTPPAGSSIAPENRPTTLLVAVSEDGEHATLTIPMDELPYVLRALAQIRVV